MRKFLSSIRIRISGAVYLSYALALLVLPIKWLVAAVAAAIFHELCHWAAVRLCGCRILGITVGMFGAVMEADSMSRSREMICALAGPVGGLLLLFLAPWLPRVAICGAFHSLYNLLPLRSLDGGRALRCAAAILLSPPAANNLCVWTEAVCKAAILLIGVYATFCLGLGLLPVIAALMVFARTNFVKIPCKWGVQKVQ